MTFSVQTSPKCCVRFMTSSRGCPSRVTQLQGDNLDPDRRFSCSLGWQGFIRPCETARRDHWGETLWNVCGALVQSVDLPTPKDRVPAGWFPTHRFALDWLAFIRQKEHPEDSFPDGPDAAHSQFAVH
jgi:hypothetical protein